MPKPPICSLCHRLTHHSSGCSAAALWSSCRSQSPRCAASRCVQVLQGEDDNNNNSVVFTSCTALVQSDRTVTLFGALTFLKRGSGDLSRALSVAHGGGAGAGLAVGCSSAGAGVEGRGRRSQTEANTRKMAKMFCFHF